LPGNWICGGRGLRGGAWWDGDELSVNESILGWRRVRRMLGTWVGERLRRKGGFRFGCELRRWLPLGRQSSRGDAERMQASGSLGVKEPPFFYIFSQADSGASAGRSPAAGAAGAVSAARAVSVARAVAAARAVSVASVGGSGHRGRWALGLPREISGTAPRQRARGCGAAAKSRPGAVEVIS
jgi:hypothetical protein